MIGYVPCPSGAVVVAVAERHVDAEYHHLTLVHHREVLFKPFELFVGEAGLIVIVGSGHHHPVSFESGCEDIVHPNYVHVSPVERPAGRAETSGEMLYGRLGILARSPPVVVARHHKEMCS